MPTNINALPIHSTKAKQSTNITNHDMNATSSDRTSTHVTDGKKKRVDAHKQRRLEVPPVVQKAMVSLGFLFCYDRT